MKTPLFLWATLLSGSLLSGSFCLSAAEISREMLCIQKSAAGVEEMFPSMKGFKEVIDYATEKAPEPMRKQWEAAENFRLDLIQKLKASPEVAGKPPYVGGKGADGRETHTFYLNYFPSKDLEDKKLVRERLQALCKNLLGSYPEIVVERCVESYFTRTVEGPSSIEAFNKANEATEKEMAERPPTGSESWADKVKGQDFKVASGEMANNLELGENIFMPVSYLAQRFGGRPPMVTNKNNQVVGILVPVQSGNKTLFYFAELRGAEVLWPYHFVFGQDLQDDWNQAFEKRHGGLFVNGRSLSDFTHHNSGDKH